MSVIIKVPEENLWKSICKEFVRPSSDLQNDNVDYQDYDPAVQHPVFYGYIYSKVTTYENSAMDFDPSVSHPACVGYALTDIPKMSVQSNPTTAPDRKTLTEIKQWLHDVQCLQVDLGSQCKFSQLLMEVISRKSISRVLRTLCFSNFGARVNRNTETGKAGELFQGQSQEYLEHYVFPTLVQGLIETLKQAKLENCFKRKRTKFRTCDFLTEYLYKNNSNFPERQDVYLWDIPFVKDWLKDHPRSSLPKSLLWSVEEASVVIQSFWRGYKVRCQAEIQELRQWQRDWQQENCGIQVQVNDFWKKKMPDWQQPTPSSSDESNPILATFQH